MTISYRGAFPLVKSTFRVSSRRYSFHGLLSIEPERKNSYEPRAGSGPGVNCLLLNKVSGSMYCTHLCNGMWYYMRRLISDKKVAHLSTLSWSELLLLLLLPLQPPFRVNTFTPASVCSNDHVLLFLQLGAKVDGVWENTSLL